jgi:purine-binding chemotaxis protein CheW|uniref:Purine-binding chemotaxis protein CheW n=1 Tax=Mesoaciditoga lauensis TaxID=1495039 RepID=A0A7V3VTM1_9BACT
MTVKAPEKPFEILGLIINDREYAVDIEMVELIVETPEIAKVPNSKDFLKGVMNLRGRIVPVVDTKKLTKSSGKESNPNSNIVITRIEDNEVGFLVDSVTEVMWVKPDEFDTTLKIDGSSYVKGVIMKGNRLLSFLDLAKIVKDEIDSNI